MSRLILELIEVLCHHFVICNGLGLDCVQMFKNGPEKTYFGESKNHQDY